MLDKFLEFIKSKKVILIMNVTIGIGILSKKNIVKIISGFIIVLFQKY
jgi:hypothetical protein